MSEVITLNVRSLLYGAIIGIIINCIVSLFRVYKNQKSDRGRFVINLSLVSNAWLLLQYVIWFFVDSLDIANTQFWADYHVSGTLNFIEMTSVPLSLSSIASLTRLRKTSYREVLYLIAPILLCTILFHATEKDEFVYAGYIYVVAVMAIVLVNAIINVKVYQRLLQQTYADTSKRDISWVLSLLYIFLSLFALWTVIGIIVPTVLGDCIYMTVSIIVTSTFVYQLCHHSLDVNVMADMHESGEENNEDVIEDDTLVLSDGDQPLATTVQETGEEAVEHPVAGIEDSGVVQIVSEVSLPQSKVKLKAWQEPRFDAAVRKYCNQVEVFTNPDLSVQDVATGVGSNRTYVSRWCKENEKDFSTYITNIRLDYAEKLVATTSQPISEIAEDSGFSNTRHFRTVFVDRFGCTPSEYRALKKESV